MEKVTLVNSFGYDIPVSFSAKEGSDSAALHIFGLKAHQNPLLNPYVKRYLKINSASMDYWGFGGNNSPVEEFSFYEAFNEVDRTMRYLKDTLGVKNFYIFAESFAGAIALFTALRKDCVKGLALRSPVINLEDFFNKNFEMDENKIKGKLGFIEFASSVYREAKDIDKEVAKNKHRLPPTFIVHGEKDRIVPIRQSLNFANETANVSLQINEDERHSQNFRQRRYFSLEKFLIEGVREIIENGETRQDYRREVAAVL